MNHGKSKSRRRSRITWKRQQGLHTQQQSSNVCVCVYVCARLYCLQGIYQIHTHTHTRTLSKQYKGIQFLPGQRRRRRRRSKSLPCRKIKITDGCCCCCACVVVVAVAVAGWAYVQETSFMFNKQTAQVKRTARTNAAAAATTTRTTTAKGQKQQVEIHRYSYTERN